MSVAWTSTLAGNIISFSVGTTITWASPELDLLKNSTMAVTDNQGSWVNSLLHLGAVFGPFLFGFLADKIGRKPTLLSLGVPITLGYLLMAFVEVVEVFYVARFMTGVAVGGLFTVMPMYIGEIADSANRGVLAGVLNIMLCIGMLFSYCVGPYVSILVFNLLLAIIPASFIPIFFFFSVESPRFLLNKQKSHEAKVTLTKLRGNTANIEDEVAAIETAIKEEGKGTFADIFSSKGNRTAFVIAVGLIIFQQFSGINAVLSNAQTIFKDAGTPISPEVCSIILGVVQLVSSFVCMTLIDRLGRKILLLASSVGMVLSELPLGVYSYLKDQGKDVDSISFIPIVCMLVYMLLYNVGSGTLPWTIMGELFPSNIKSIGASLTASICWLLGFIIVYNFKNLSDSIGLGPCFWIFSVFCAISIVFIQFLCFETKGKTLEEIQLILNR